MDSLPKGTFTITMEHYKGELDKKFNMGLTIFAKNKVVYKQSEIIASPEKYNTFAFKPLTTITDGKGLVIQSEKSSP